MFLFKYLPIRPLTSLHIPQVSAVPLTPFTCNTIWDNEGAKSYSKRVGRGPGSGKGKTCGRGHKGRKQRRGGTVKLWYEGGQANIIKRLPKRGFSRAQFNEPLETINFDQLYYYIERGRLNPSDPITIKSMWNAGAFGQIKYGVKLLARGAEKIDRPLHFEVMDASQTAIDQVKKAGGSVTIIYKTPVQVKYMIKPEAFDVPIQEDSIPPPYVAIKLEKMKQKGVTVQYNQPEWIKNVDLKTFEVQPIVKLVASDKKRVKPQVYRHYNFEV